MNLVASIHSHAERVSSAYYEARRSGLTMNGMTHSIARRYEFLFLGLSILAVAALINSGIGALRAISAFFFASAVYLLIGGILVQEALFCAVAFAFFALLAPWLVAQLYESTPLPKFATPSTLPSTSASPPSSNLKPKRSACTPSEIFLF